MCLVRENITPPKYMEHLIFGALFVLALGLLTSTSILALSHILMLFPCLYFAAITDWRALPKSAWGLLGTIITIIISIVLNQDIADKKGLLPLFKVKYFIIGFSSLVPFYWWKKRKMTDRQISLLIYLFCISASVATIAGIVGMETGYNYISMRTVNFDRNAGLSGMVLNYAHNLSYFLVIIFGLLMNFKKLQNFVNPIFLLIVFVLNLVGLYLSYTRGAILAFLIGAMFYFFKNHKKFFLLIGTFSVVLIIITYATSNGILRPGSDNERISQWRAAVIAFQERPILGYGYLNFENHSVNIKKRYNLGQLQFGGHAHNNFLEILATTGGIGFICYSAWLFFWLVEVYKKDGLLAQISFPLIIALIISGMTQSTVSLGVNLFFIMAVYALSFSGNPRREEKGF